MPHNSVRILTNPDLIFSPVRECNTYKGGAMGQLVRHLIFSIVICGAISGARTAIAADPAYEEYFTLEEDTHSSTEDSSIYGVPGNKIEIWNLLRSSNQNDRGSLDLFPVPVKSFKKSFLQLLRFSHHNGLFGVTGERYNRTYHYGGWVRDRRDPDCYNTRARILMRDSQIPVEMNADGCAVVSGLWQDPYSGGRMELAREVDIDHFVPLRNSFISGAWKWSYEKRCLYANFVGNDYHLIAVSLRENRKKGDRAPDGYMPSNKDYACNYLQQWLKVKMIWSLGLTPPEVFELRRQVEANHCDSREFVMNRDELLEQRALIAGNMNLCRPRSSASAH